MSLSWTLFFSRFRPFLRLEVVTWLPQGSQRVPFWPLWRLPFWHLYKEGELLHLPFDCCGEQCKLLVPRIYGNWVRQQKHVEDLLTKGSTCTEKQETNRSVGMITLLMTAKCKMLKTDFYFQLPVMVCLFPYDMAYLHVWYAIMTALTCRVLLRVLEESSGRVIW